MGKLVLSAESIFQIDISIMEKMRFIGGYSYDAVGAAVNTLQIQFWNSWNQTDGESFELGRGYLNRFPLTDEDASGVGFTASDPGSPAPFNMEAIIAGINEAKNMYSCVRHILFPAIN
jgi:hypothetical protein